MWAEEKEEWQNDTKNRAFKVLSSWWNFFNNKGYEVGKFILGSRLRDSL